MRLLPLDQKVPEWHMSAALCMQVFFVCANSSVLAFCPVVPFGVTLPVDQLARLQSSTEGTATGQAWLQMVNAKQPCITPTWVQSLPSAQCMHSSNPNTAMLLCHHLFKKASLCFALLCFRGSCAANCRPFHSWETCSTGLGQQLWCRPAPMPWSRTSLYSKDP